MPRRPLARLASLALPALVPLAGGCATLVDAGPDMVPVQSSPEGARVLLDGTPVGVTPCTVAVPRDSEGVFAIELTGHKPAVLDRDKVLNGWIFGNIVFGWLSPAGVAADLATSSQGKYSTDPIDVTLEPGMPSERAGAPSGG